MEPIYLKHNYYQNNTVNEDKINDRNQTLLILLLVFIFIGKLWWEYQWRIWEEHNHIIPRNNLNQRLLNSPTYNPNDIEKKEIKYNNEIHNDRECTICLEEYEENNDLYQLQCGHYYHKECIDDWLLKHQTCPLCRLNLV